MPYSSPGASAMDALQEALLQREKQKQQDLINSLAQDQNNRANAASARADAEMKRQAQLDQQKQLDEAVKRQATADTGTIDAMHPAMGDVLQGDLLSAFQRQQPAAIASKPGLTSTSTIGGMAPIGDTSTPDATSTSTSTSDALPIFRGTQLQQDAAAKDAQTQALLATLPPDQLARAKQAKALGLTGDALAKYMTPPEAKTPEQPATVREYEYNNAQRQAAGQPPLTFEQYQNADANRHQPAPPAGPDQNKLEGQYRTNLARVVSSRSGGLGLEDQKVNQANHLLGLLDQYDGKPMPSNVQAELALGLARLTSPNGQVGEGLMKEFNSRTAQGKFADAISYVTGDPTLVNASPDQVREVFRSSIQRQGEIAVQNREGEMNYVRGLAPTDLEESRRQKLEAATLNPLRSSKSSGKSGSLPAGVTVTRIK